MKDYKTITKTVKAIEYNQINLIDLYQFIGDYLKNSVPQSEVRSKAFTINETVSNTSFGDYIVFDNDKFSRMTKDKFESTYELV